MSFMRVRQLQFTPSEAAFIAGVPQREVQKAFDEDWFDIAPRRDARGAVRRCLGPAELVHLRLLKDVASYAVLQTATKKLIHGQLRQRIPDVVLADGDYLVLVEVKRTEPGEPPVRADALLSLIERKIQSSQAEKDLERWLANQHDIERCFFVSSADDHSTELRSWFDLIIKRLKEPVHVAPIRLDAAAACEQIAERFLEALAAQLAVVSDADIRGGEPVVRGTRIPVYLLQDLKLQGATGEELLADYPSLDERRLQLALLYARIHPRPGRPKKRPWSALAAQ
jgi:uncharacterized protein (DUF433 family)/Holliday junction resolvase-like predicted endonuclease